jgi:hypothetical protein
MGSPCTGNAECEGCSTVKCESALFLVRRREVWIRRWKADKTFVVHISELVGETPRLDVHVFFNLGQDLTLHGFGVGDRFEASHEMLHRQKKLDHAFAPAELDAFHNLTYLIRPPNQALASPEATH